jgi:hypothetical protein
MGKKLKIVAAVIGGIIVLIVIGAMYFEPDVVLKTDPNKITGISQFVVLKDGSLYKVRFSLVDQNNAYVTSDAHIHFFVCCDQSATTPILLYNAQGDIKAEQFQTYNLVISGAPIVAYAWQIDGNAFVNSYSNTATLVVTLPGGKSFTAHASV